MTWTTKNRGQPAAPSKRAPQLRKNCLLFVATEHATENPAYADRKRIEPRHLKKQLGYRRQRGAGHHDFWFYQRVRHTRQGNSDRFPNDQIRARQPAQHRDQVLFDENLPRHVDGEVPKPDRAGELRLIALIGESKRLGVDLTLTNFEIPFDDFETLCEEVIDRSSTAKGLGPSCDAIQ